MPAFDPLDSRLHDVSYTARLVRILSFKAAKVMSAQQILSRLGQQIHVQMKPAAMDKAVEEWWYDIAVTDHIAISLFYS